MDLKIEVDWKKFIEDSCGNDGAITPTPLYTAIADSFPIALTHKLVFFARNDDFDLSTRQRAAFLLKAMAEDPHHLDDAYPTVDRETTLPYLRRCSFWLMVDNERGSPFQNAGKALAKKLITLVLRHGEKWDGFLEWLQRGFSGQPHVCELIFDIHSNLGLGSRLCVPFTLFVLPIVKQNYNQFRTRLADLLLRGEEDDSHEHNRRGFNILTCFYFIFFENKDHLTSIMEAAILSPIFDYNPHPDEEKMIFAARCIELCIEHGPAFKFPPLMIRKMAAILRRLNDSADQPDGRNVANALINLLRRLRVNIRRRR